MDGLAAFAYQAEHRGALPEVGDACACQEIIGDICNMRWEGLDHEDILRVAHAYYFFSVQFRENLEIACGLLPNDLRLCELHRGECRTDNLSPWPGIARAGERLDHDEFMRRLLALRPIDDGGYLDTIGEIYLNRVRRVDDAARAASIASYEDGGLSRVFSAMLRAPDWNGAPQQAFRFFLEQHIRFDTDDDGGHGSLSRHLVSHDDILPLWAAFREILATAVPQLSHPVGVF
jgi:hypothetical protein